MRNLFLSILLCLVSCQTFRRPDYKKDNQEEFAAFKAKYEHCYGKWIYKDLPYPMKIYVLRFDEKSRYDLTQSPNFIAGVNEKGDTIGILDLNYEKTIKLNSSIIADTSKWTDNEKEFYQPYFSLYFKHSDNELTCSIKTIYFGKIR